MRTESNASAPRCCELLFQNNTIGLFYSRTISLSACFVRFVAAISRDRSPRRATKKNTGGSRVILFGSYYNGKGRGKIKMKKKKHKNRDTDDGNWILYISLQRGATMGVTRSFYCSYCGYWINSFFFLLRSIDPFLGSIDRERQIIFIVLKIGR